VSLEKGLLDRFDKHIRGKSYATRSKAIADLIQEDLIRKEWSEGNEDVAGAITVVYNHHKRELVNTLLDIQHDYQHLIVSTQHVHLSHEHCLEVIVVKGKPVQVQELAKKLKAGKGVKHGSLTMTTTGK